MNVARSILVAISLGAVLVTALTFGVGAGERNAHRVNVSHEAPGGVCKLGTACP